MRAGIASLALLPLVWCARPAGAQGVMAPGAGQGTRPLAPSGPRPGAFFSIDASSHSESNVRFFGPIVQGDRYQRAGANFSLGAASARSRVEFDAQGEIVRFDLLRDLDRQTYNFGLRLNHRVSPRVTSQLVVRALTSAAPDAVQTLTLAFQPLAVVRTQTAVASVVTRLAPTVDLTTDAEFVRSRFDDPTFIGGDNGGMRVTLGVRPNPHTVRGVVADIRRATFLDQAVDLGLLEGEWRRVVGRVQLAMRAGATTLLPSDFDATARVIPTGSVELKRTQGPYALAMGYAHAVTPVFGFGRALQSDQVSVVMARTRDRGTSLRVTVDGSRNVDPIDRTVNINFATAEGQVRQYLGLGLTLAVSGFARRRIDGERASNVGGSVLLALGGGR